MVELFSRPGRERLFWIQCPEWRRRLKRTEKKEERMHTPIKYNQEASLNFVLCERRRGGILAYL